jgi:Fe-S-cluster containining protein
MAGRELAFDDLKLHLHVLDGDHLIEARARIGPTRVRELLPLAREIAEGVVAIALAHSAAEGNSVSCRAGCAACCRQVVPIAPLEAVRLAEVVNALPKERRKAVKKRFENAARRMADAGLVERRAPPGRAALVSAKTDAKEAWEDASRRYFQAGIPCPFLEDESCSIYSERPMVCREYNVTTPASLCAEWSTEVRDIARPVRMSEVMTAATNALLGREDLAIPLTLALEWASANPGAFDHQGDGEEMALDLVRCIQEADDSG